MKSHNYYVYILTNFTNTTFYIGVTNNLERRILEHKQEVVKGFSKKYHLSKLIYYEEFPSIGDAISREKQLKNWHHDWKLNLIKNVNPKLFDLHTSLEDAETSSA
jgi:putative endonuclease